MIADTQKAMINFSGKLRAGIDHGINVNYVKCIVKNI